MLLGGGPFALDAKPCHVFHHMLPGELDIAEYSISYARPFRQAESWPFGCEGELDVIPSKLSVDFHCGVCPGNTLLLVPQFLASVARRVGFCLFSRTACEGRFPPHPSQIDAWI